MEVLVQRLVKLNYTFEKAIELYIFYREKNDLDGLIQYVEAKESLGRTNDKTSLQNHVRIGEFSIENRG